MAAGAEFSREQIPTIASVAKEAGVSRATVSRAFGAPHLLSRATVESVRAVASRIGYTPNQTARALSTGQSGNLALVAPDIANPFFAVIMRGAQARARSAGFVLFLGDADESPDLENELLTKLAPQVDGFVLVSPRIDHDCIRRHAGRRPLVLINSDVSALTRLLVDTARSYARAVELLAGLGHRSIAYVAGPDLSWSNAQRSQAVVSTARRLGLDVLIVATERPNFESGRDCAAQLSSTGVTAALAFDDIVAQGLVAGLAERDVWVPKDFSVVGCDGIIATTTFPALTSIDTNCRAAGERAIDLLIAMVQGRSAIEERIVLSSDLIVRASTSEAPKRRAQPPLNPKGLSASRSDSRTPRVSRVEPAP